MNLFSSSRHILARWQRETERATEAFQASEQSDSVSQRLGPLLHLGPVQDALPGLEGLQALQTFAATRRDLAAPLVLAGGDSGLWLLALAEQHNTLPLAAIDATDAIDETDVASEQSLPLYTIYGGVDRATYAASSTTASDAAARRISVESVADWQLAPARQPAAPLMGSALPFVPASELDFDGDRRLAWLAVALAIALLLGALVA